MNEWVGGWLSEWVNRQVENFYSSVSLISSITHSFWCTWHFHDKSFCHWTSAPGAKVLKCSICPERKSGEVEREKEKQRERIAKNNQGGLRVCVYMSCHSSKLLSSGELLTVAGSSEWIAKVTVFWVTSAVKKNREERTRWRRVLTDWEQECLLSGAVSAKCQRISSCCWRLIKPLTSDKKEIIW